MSEEHNEAVEQETKTKYSEEEAELLGVDPSKLSREKQQERLALLAERQEHAEEEEKRRRIEAEQKQEQLKRDTSVRFLTQYHPCSFCGGSKTKVLADSKQPRVVRGMEMVQPSRQGDAPPLIICYKCQLKVFTTPLGQARFYKQEMEHLTGIGQSKGFFPLKK